jgi:hypothetical protein
MHTLIERLIYEMGGEDLAGLIAILGMTVLVVYIIYLIYRRKRGRLD